MGDHGGNLQPAGPQPAWRSLSSPPAARYEPLAGAPGRYSRWGRGSASGSGRDRPE